MTLPKKRSSMLLLFTLLLTVPSLYLFSTTTNFQFAIVVGTVFCDTCFPTASVKSLPFYLRFFFFLSFQLHCPILNESGLLYDIILNLLSNHKKKFTNFFNSLDATLSMTFSLLICISLLSHSYII